MHLGIVLYWKGITVDIATDIVEKETADVVKNVSDIYIQQIIRCLKKDCIMWQKVTINWKNTGKGIELGVAPNIPIFDIDAHMVWN